MLRRRARRQTGNKSALAASFVLAALAALSQHPGVVSAAETANDDDGLSRPISHYELLGLEDEWTHRRKSGVLHNRKKRANYRNRILTSDIKKVELFLSWSKGYEFKNNSISSHRGRLTGRTPNCIIQVSWHSSSIRYLVFL